MVYRRLTDEQVERLTRLDEDIQAGRRFFVTLAKVCAVVGSVITVVSILTAAFHPFGVGLPK